MIQIRAGSPAIGHHQSMELGPSHTYLEQAPEPEPDLPEEELTRPQKLADSLSATVGSWKFILLQSIMIALWVTVNLAWARGWDPYPFILLNLFLSFQAAYTGPIVLMSQNRLAERDRLTQASDLRVDLRAEREIEVIMEHLVHHDRLLHRLEHKLDQLHQSR
ncbi:DUF1003 domain-containing protein [bacterium CPR1]|nr:DUF1003 domain-containing protein [bacterium CPR1]